MNEMLQFEREKCRDLRRFPMYFRLKLDLCGIKLSKRDWNSFTLPEKEELLAMPCETREEIAAFREQLKTLIRAHGGDLVELAGIAPLWHSGTAAPERVRQQIQQVVGGRANLERWADLSDLQRFALIKLTEPGKTKPALEQVLQDFRLLPSQGSFA